MTLTLSQRLTRAGLTFILLGTAAAVLPQQTGSVRADDCVINEQQIYRLTTDLSGAHPSIATTISTIPGSGFLPTVNLYTFLITGIGGSPVLVPSTFAVTTGTAITISPIAGTSTTVSIITPAPPATVNVVTSTYTVGSMTYTAMETVNVV